MNESSYSLTVSLALIASVFGLASPANALLYQASGTYTYSSGGCNGEKGTWTAQVTINSLTAPQAPYAGSFTVSPSTPGALSCEPFDIATAPVTYGTGGVFLDSTNKVLMFYNGGNPATSNNMVQLFTAAAFNPSNPNDAPLLDGTNNLTQFNCSVTEPPTNLTGASGSWCTANNGQKFVFDGTPQFNIPGPLSPLVIAPFLTLFGFIRKRYSHA